MLAQIEKELRRRTALDTDAAARKAEAEAARKLAALQKALQREKEKKWFDRFLGGAKRLGNARAAKEARAVVDPGLAARSSHTAELLRLRRVWRACGGRPRHSGRVSKIISASVTQ